MASQAPYADCQFARDALAGTTGKDVKGSVDNLTKAFQHAKTCKTCSDAVAEFLQQLIKELGVKLPSVNTVSGDREPDYNPEESQATKKDAEGPGTVGWSPKSGGAEYQFKPTVSTLALTVQELQEKCRLKDAMIQAMADEFRHLGRCRNWSGAELMSQVADADVACTKIDFDRRALCNYLNEKPVHSFETTTEEEKEYKATNPLGLRVTRQIGPDSILVEWDCPPPGRVFAFEIYINGLFAQHVRSGTRTKTILHPVDLSSKIYITLNALAYTGENCAGATIPYP